MKSMSSEFLESVAMAAAVDYPAGSYWRGLNNCQGMLNVPYSSNRVLPTTVPYGFRI